MNRAEMQNSPHSEGNSVGDEEHFSDRLLTDSSNSSTNPFAESNLLIPTTAVLEQQQMAVAAVTGKEFFPAGGKTHPFTRDVLAKMAKLCIDVDALIARYYVKTKGKRIANPNGYLLRMAYDEVSKREGIPVALAEKLYGADKSATASAETAVLAPQVPLKPIGMGGRGPALVAALKRGRAN